MITSLLLYIVGFIVSLIGLLLPSGFALPAVIAAAFTYFFQFLGMFPFAPTSASLAAMLSLVFAWELGMLTWRVVNWIIRKIPGVS